MPKTTKKPRRTKKAKTRIDPVAEVAATFVAMLEDGVAPWRRPWSTRFRCGGVALPHSANTGRAYRGVNVILLAFAPFSVPYWLTNKQAATKGLQVRKGEKGTKIVFTNFMLLDPKTGKRLPDSAPAAVKAKAKKIPLVRFYTVFNVEQLSKVAYGDAPEPTEEDPKPKRPVVSEDLEGGVRYVEKRFKLDFSPKDVAPREPGEIPEAEEVLRGYLEDRDGPPIDLGGDRACYSPAEDKITAPKREQFKSDASFYCTLFHEVTHSTGHKDRLARPGVTDSAAFGSHTYGKEELVAELGASFLCAHAGIDVPEVTENSAAYLASWIRTIKGEPRLVLQAAGAAQRAVDLVLGFDPSVKAEEEEGA